MISRVFNASSANLMGERFGGYYYLVGLSGDTKPTDVPNGMPFLEMDTGKIFLFDAANSVWYEQ